MTENSVTELQFIERHLEKMKELEKKYGCYVLSLPKIREINEYGTLFINVQDLPYLVNPKVSPQLVLIREMDYSRDYHKAETLSFRFLNRLYEIDVFHNKDNKDFYVLNASLTNELYYFHTLNSAVECMKSVAFFESLSYKGGYVVISAPPEKEPRIYLDDPVVDK